MQERDDIVALDSAIILNPRVWEASGHVAGFTDPLVDCRTCKLRFRADQLERRAVRHASRRKRPGETPDCDLTEARQFNLMFETHGRPGRGERLDGLPAARDGAGHLRQLQERRSSSRAASRRSGSRRSASRSATRSRRATSSSATREFEQMEMEFFVPPAEAEEWYRYWIDAAPRLVPATRPPRRATCASASTTRTSCSHYSSGDERHRVPVPDRLVGARGHREPRRLRPDAARRALRDEARVLRPGRRALRAVRDRARRGVERTSSRCSSTPTTRRRSAERERTVLRLHPRIAPVKAAVLPLSARTRAWSATGARALRGAARGTHGRVRRRRRDRPPLPAPGRDRDAVRVHGRRADARGRHGHDPRTATRSRRSGSRSPASRAGSRTRSNGRGRYRRAIKPGRSSTFSDGSPKPNFLYSPCASVVCSSHFTPMQRPFDHLADELSAEPSAGDTPAERRRRRDRRSRRRP